LGRQPKGVPPDLLDGVPAWFPSGKASRIYQNAGWTGWHAGKERIAAGLQASKNVIVIETGSQFSLSVTDTNDW
jgi:hypothetical protein